MLKTLGGDRLGTGSKMQVAMKNYERSTHNLSNAFRSSMAPGVLVPFYKKICTNGDTWSEDLSALVRTVPANGPLFGAYKLQLDMFQIPIRLYNGVLHNNWLKLGMDADKVKLPKMRMKTVIQNPEYSTEANKDTCQISSSSLWAYCGLRGVGGYDSVTGAGLPEVRAERFVQCVPILAYYDIFKNYYANKQEKYAYVINAQTYEYTDCRPKKFYNNRRRGGRIWELEGYVNPMTPTEQTAVQRNLRWSMNTTPETYIKNRISNLYTISLSFEGNLSLKDIPIVDAVDIDSGNLLRFNINDTTYVRSWSISQEGDGVSFTLQNNAFNTGQWVLSQIYWNGYSTEKGDIYLQEFDLENIDRARMAILKDTGLNNQFIVGEDPDGYTNTYPYKANFEYSTPMFLKARYPMVGLVTKTYQSDIFNNWLNSEWIDGLNGIAAVTAVDTSSGTFTMDALNLAQKVYNMLNRIAVSGGTYEDWQEAVYGTDTIRRAESPIYCGGMSGTIVFEEVVSTADTDTAAAGDQPLGSLAGKGILTNVQNGHIEIHIKEPSYIMGIVSITPLLDYSQGNDFDITELDTINDLHKPELDGIGFQDLLLERAAWWGTNWDDINQRWVKHATGKLPAWIDYMTSVNQVYGDFCELEKAGFMVLSRRYQMGNKLFNGTNQVIPVSDFTTYIDPTKHNYQFANTKLDAQNFWVQIGINSIARRKMSAKIIPNL